MTNEEKAKNIANICVDCYRISNPHDCGFCQSQGKYDGAMQMAQWKDEQPISEQGGWHTEEPTEDGWYLVDTPYFPKNCHCVVAEWDNDAKRFYSEESDYPIDFHKWKLIERR